MARPPMQVITAMGLVSALGDTVDANFRAWRAAVPVLSPPPFELPFTTVCGVVPGPFTPVGGSYAPYDTRLARIVVRAIEQVTTHVERARARFGSERIAVLVGTSTGGLDVTEPAYHHYRATGQPAPGLSLWRTHAFDATAQLVQRLLHLNGPSYAVSTACTSAAKALAAAQRLLRHDVCDAALVIGADALCQTTVRGFHSLGILSARGARPFASGRDGIHIGEGAACLLIERNGDGPVAIAGIGETSDAHAMSAPHPEGRGAIVAMREALARAQLTPDEVDYVHAHGTGTERNDEIESLAIRDALSERVPVASAKGLLGHTLGASGAFGVAFTALTMARGEIPRSAGAEPVDAALPIRVLTENVARSPRVALCNAFAFGGSNASIVVQAT